MQSEEDIEQLQSKHIELQDVGTALNKEVERLVKMEMVSVPCSETNDNHVAEREVC